MLLKKKNHISADRIKAVVIGHAVADALGVPVEFRSRESLDPAPVTDMMGYGTYPYPAGTWSDDTSMALAALDSLATGKVDFDEVMKNFAKWFYEDDYTPTGKLFDVGGTCARAIERYSEGVAPTMCGLAEASANGNGALMRIHPFVLYAYRKGMRTKEWERLIFDASALTHRHRRSLIGSGIYTFVLLELLATPEEESVYKGLEKARARYEKEPEAVYYQRIFRDDFAKLPREQIKSSGYVVDTLEAALWCLLTTDSYRECVLKAANLGEDTDTVAAIAGGLAGALYGFSGIDGAWRQTLLRLDYIEQMCDRAYLSW